jgi:hypothetical protein
MRLLGDSNFSPATELLLTDPCVKNNHRHPQESLGASVHQICWHAERILLDGCFPQNP